MTREGGQLTMGVCVDCLETCGRGGKATSGLQGNEHQRLSHCLTVCFGFGTINRLLGTKPVYQMVTPPKPHNTKFAHPLTITGQRHQTLGGQYLEPFNYSARGLKVGHKRNLITICFIGKRVVPGFRVCPTTFATNGKSKIPHSS